MGPILKRSDSAMPYQEWRAFPPHAIVQVWNAYGDSRINVAGRLWWGYQEECGDIGEGVIIKARRLDRPRKNFVYCGDIAETKNGILVRIP